MERLYGGGKQEEPPPTVSMGILKDLEFMRCVVLNEPQKKIQTGRFRGDGIGFGDLA